MPARKHQAIAEQIGYMDKIVSDLQVLLDQLMCKNRKWN